MLVSVVFVRVISKVFALPFVRLNIHCSIDDQISIIRSPYNSQRVPTIAGNLLEASCLEATIMLNRLFSEVTIFNAHLGVTEALRIRQMTVMASRITGQSSVCTTFGSNKQQKNIKGPRYWSSVMGIHRRPVDSPHKWQVTRKMFPFDDIIMDCYCDVLW